MASALFPKADHDHAHCTKTLIEFAEHYCSTEGLRFTRLRRDVLCEVAASHKAIGAYQILDNFAAQGRKLSPISVYRSLDFLQEAGLIHRLDSTNSYFACQRPLEADQACCTNHPLVFLVCDDCGTIGEVDGAPLAPLIERFAAHGDFESSQGQLEIKGLCRFCQQAD